MDPREALNAGRTSAPLQLYLLGRFEATRGADPIAPEAWRRRRPADLLKLVALSPRCTVDRDAAIELLWPGKDPASGANNLHRALYDLRQVLGGRFVDVARGVLALDAEVWVDAVAFEQGLDAGDEARVEAALALYRGDLSPEDREWPWLAARREALRQRFADAALPVAAALASRGEAARAIPLLRRVLEAQPASEAAAVALVRLLAESGRRGEALRVYEACERAVAAAGRSPQVALREVRDAIQRGAVGRAQPRGPYDGARRAAQRLLGSPTLAPLRGGSAAHLLVESLLEQGAGTIVLLGEAGVGTTRLALEGARLAQEGGALVLAGSAAGVAAPLAPFADALADWSRGGGPPDPLAPSTPAALARGAVFDAVRSALATAGRPVVLVVDDLHEIDEPSASLFHQLAREARALRLVLLATCREERVRAGTPVQALLAHLDCERLARGVRVQRLDASSTRALVEDALAEPPPEAVAAQIHRLSDGLPFHALELARGWAERGRLPAGGDLAAELRDRAARLGARAGALLAAAAAAGPRFDVDVVRAPALLSRHDALEALDACLAARLVVEDGAHHRFEHPLVRDGLYAGLTAARRAELHGSLAQALSARADEADVAEQVAVHLRDAGDAASAAAHLLAAGRRAHERGALARARGWYADALAAALAAGAEPGPRIEILEAQARVELDLGDVSAALRALDTAAAIAGEPSVAARVRREASVALVLAGRLDGLRERIDGGDPLRPALEWAAAPRAEAPRWSELGAGVALALWEGELGGGRAVEELESRAAAFTAAAAGGELAALAQAVEGAVAARGHRAEVAEAALAEAARRARAAGAEDVEAFALAELGTMFTLGARIDEGLAAIGDALLAAGRAPLRRHWLVRAYAALARNRLAAGARYAADDALREASAIAARHGECARCDVALLEAAVEVAIARGRIEGAEQDVARLEAIATRRGGRAAEAARSARARVGSAAGGAGRAGGG